MASLPSSWKMIPLSHVCQREKNKTLNPLSFPDETFEYYSIPAYQEHGSPLYEVGRNILSNKILVENRTVLFGKLNPRVLKVWLVNSTTSMRKIATTEFLPILANWSAEPDYLYFLCQSTFVVNEAMRLVSGSTPSRERVDPNAFYNIHIPLPPLAEQRAIADTLRIVQDAGDSRRRQLALERERKAALIEDLFTYGVRGEPCEQTKIGPMPRSWEVVSLSQAARIERGKFAHRPRNDPSFYGGATPFIQTGDVTASGGRISTYSQSLNDKGLSVSKKFPKGTIVITIAANIGYTGVLEFDSAFPDSLVAITPLAGIDRDYLHYYLSTQQYEMDKKAPQGTQKNINIEFLSPWPLKKPSLSEQRDIAAVLTACDQKIDALETEATLHNELFRALMEELMTGRLSAAELAVK